MEQAKQEVKAEQPVSAIDAATALLAQIKAENDRRENILKQEQSLHADRMLAGTGGGGIVPNPQLTEKQIKKQQAMDFWKGTGIDKAIEKYDD